MFVGCPAPAFGSGLFLINGAGWGNGVGMSQWGAEGYALHGWDYHRILADYYPHTTIGVVPQRTVRVLIADKQPRISVSSSSPYLLVDAAGRRIHVRPRTLTLTSRLRLGHALVPPIDIEPGAQPLTLDGRGYRGSLSVVRKTADYRSSTRFCSSITFAVSPRGDAATLEHRGLLRAGDRCSLLRARNAEAWRLVRPLCRQSQPDVRRYQ